MTEQERKAARDAEVFLLLVGDLVLAVAVVAFGVAMMHGLWWTVMAGLGLWEVVAARDGWRLGIRRAAARYRREHS